MNVNELIRWLESVEDKDSEVTSINNIGNLVWLSVILPISDKRQDFHQRLAHYYHEMEDVF